MRKLSPEKLKELRKQGEILTEDGKKFIAKEKPPPATESISDLLKAHSKTAEKVVATQSAMVRVMEHTAQTSMLETVIMTQQQLVNVVAEMAKPKPLKKWDCTVSRNSDGRITTVAIAEK